MKDLTSFNLVPRAGEMILSFSTSSSGDDARTSSIPFGKLAANGGEIFLPKALKLSIQASSDVPINGGDVVCQAYKDAQGTQVLGSTFTQSKAAEIAAEPVAIGSIFCSDAGAVKARTGSDESAQTSPIPTQSAPAQVASTPSRTGTSSSAATSLNYYTAEPTTMQQAYSSKSASSASEISSSIHSATVAMISPSSVGASSTSAAAAQSTRASSTSAAAAQSTSGAGGIHTPNGWTVRRMFNISVLAACYAAWFML